MMPRWSDLATWRGPTPNQGGAMREHRGVVVHIAEGFYEGTISWQRNDDANVSSHFIVARDGRIAQMVDTDTTAWTQSAGNGHWLSVENEGFTPNSTHYRAGWEVLTPQQVEANARLLAKGHQVYGYPLRLAVNPLGMGLGHHSMGCNWPGGAWGHCDCPGDPIIAQKAQILSRAIEIVNGDDDMGWSPADTEIAIYRTEALVHALDTVRDGPTKDEPVELVKLVKQTAAKVAELTAPAPVDIPSLAAALKAELRPELEAAAEAAVRRVLGKLDEAPKV